MQQTITGGNHTHYYQTSIPFEKRDRRVTLVFTDTEVEKLTALADRRGYQLSPFLRHLVSIGLKTEKYLNSTLGDILK